MSESSIRTAPSSKRRANSDASTSRRGRPVGDHDAKRAELLEAAIQVIARDGYAGASMRRVAQHAGCTTGAVTYYFANKEEMVTAAAQNLFDQAEALMAANSDKHDLKAMIQQWHNFITLDAPDTWLAWLQLLSHARHEPAFASAIKARQQRYRQASIALLNEGQRRGEVRSDIPAELLVDVISAFSDGWLMMLPIEPERFSAERGQALLDAFISMVSPPRKDLS